MRIALGGPRLYRIAGTPAEHGGTMLATTAPDCRVRHRDFWSAMQRHSNGRLYLNFAGHGEDENLTRQAHGAEVYARLSATKQTHDPTNFFCLHQNIGIV